MATGERSVDSNAETLGALRDDGAHFGLFLAYFYNHDTCSRERVRAS